MSAFRTGPPHEFIDIPSDDVDIWRYRSFPHFISILQHEGLWLSRLDQFKDPFEGSVPKSQANRRKETAEKYYDYGSERVEEQGRVFRKQLYANCWHESQNESAALWDVYSRRGQAVAIKTNVESLLDSIAKGNGINGAGSINSMYLGRVKYIDFERHAIPSNALVRPFFKRSSFEYESEIRLAFWYNEVVDQVSENVVQVDVPQQPTGVRLNVSTDELINRIVVSPWADDWFQNLVMEMADNYGFGDRVQESELSKSPDFAP